jgi:hypothetical protein
MSAEEEETNVELSIEDQLAPENAKPTKLNKNGKPRKVLSPEALWKRIHYYYLHLSRPR